MLLFRWLLLMLGSVWLAGCASVGPQAPAAARPFDFRQDTFAYANELAWEYRVDDTTGRTVTRRRDPPPEYSLHCFVMARSAKQFFFHARFDPALGRTNDAGYARLVREVLARGARTPRRDATPVVIPGFANLREFSTAHERILKQACGGAWQSYLQRGHWRMLFPFARHHQEHAAATLCEELRDGAPLVVHLVRFPSLAINHAVVLFDFAESEREVRFSVYDPNSPEAPIEMRFNRQSRRFSLPPTKYFAGGRVDVYEVYRNAVY